MPAPPSKPLSVDALLALPVSGVERELLDQASQALWSAVDRMHVNNCGPIVCSLTPSLSSFNT